jgi:calpain-7
LQEIELRIPVASTQHEALQIAIEAVEVYMQAMKFAAGNRERARLKEKCQILLKTAESLKKADTRQQVKAPAKVLKGPVSTRTFTTKEQVILLEGSKLNGFIFQPWDSDPDPEEFHPRDGEGLFTYGDPLQTHQSTL